MDALNSAVTAKTNGNDVDQWLEDWTDRYFGRTKAVVERFGDKQVTYAVFMRRPIISAPRLAVEWLQNTMQQRGQKVDIEVLKPEGTFVGAGDPILYITGSLVNLVETETIYLMKLGSPCVAAMNAYEMCTNLPKASFLAMDARHCAGTEMAELMAYGASVGSEQAKKAGAVGFIGNATNATAHFFGQPKGYGTMPHALIGYCGSTVRAAEMMNETFPGEPMTVLADYFGREITDSLAVAHRFPELAATGKLSFRIDTTASRFVEGLDPQSSYAVLERYAPASIRAYRTEKELSHLVGPGVSAAGLFRLREALDAEGFNNVKIVASSGFSPAKCKIMAEAGAPIDVVGTGSFIPSNWSETYATSDIIEYGGKEHVKLGREFLFRKKPAP